MYPITLCIYLTSETCDNTSQTGQIKLTFIVSGPIIKDSREELANTF